MMEGSAARRLRFAGEASPTRSASTSPAKRGSPRRDRVVEAYCAQLREKTKALSLESLVMPRRLAPRGSSRSSSPYSMTTSVLGGGGVDGGKRIAAFSLQALLDENFSPELDENFSPELRADDVVVAASPPASPSRAPPAPPRHAALGRPHDAKAEVVALHGPAPPSDRQPLAPASMVRHVTVEHAAERRKEEAAASAARRAASMAVLA